MRTERVEIDGLKRFLMRRVEDDGRRDSSVEGFFPAVHAQAPPVAGGEAGEVVHGPRRREVVAARLREGEKVGCHLSADDVGAVVVGAGPARAVAVESGHRVGAAGAEVVAENVAGHGRGRWAREEWSDVTRQGRL